MGLHGGGPAPAGRTLRYGNLRRIALIEPRWQGNALRGFVRAAAGEATRSLLEGPMLGDTYRLAWWFLIRSRERGSTT